MHATVLYSAQQLDGVLSSQALPLSFPLSIAGYYSETDSSPVHNYAHSGRPLNGARRVRLPFPPLESSLDPSASSFFCYIVRFTSRVISALASLRPVQCSSYSAREECGGKQTRTSTPEIVNKHRSRDDNTKERIFDEEKSRQQ